MLEFKRLITRPTTAWPTVALFGVALVAYVTSMYLGISGRWPAWISVAINSISAYWMFTVGHDASHNSLSLRRWLNNGLGRISVMTLLPFPLFRMFRFVHMQHHRFSNEPEDPDYWVGKGSVWLLPLRCALIDIKYIFWYAARLGNRPKDEVLDSAVAVLVGLIFWSWVLSRGWGYQAAIFWLLPSRVAIVFLAYAFDYLPHSPYKATDAGNKYVATSVRAGAEWLMTPLLLSQNYHLVHHLYPLVPFYRYVKVWRARERFHLSQAPLLVSVGSTELNAEQYLRLRKLP